MSDKAIYRVTLLIEWDRVEGQPRLPLTPVRTSRYLDGHWAVEFDVEGSSFDQAAGQLWGEAAACGIDARVAAPARDAPS